MIGVLAVFEVLPGQEADFEAVMREFVQDVRTKETGVTYFDLYRHASGPNVYAIFERYENEEAFRAHGNAPHFLALEQKLGGMLSGPPSFNVHQLVA